MFNYTLCLQSTGPHINHRQSPTHHYNNVLNGIELNQLVGHVSMFSFGFRYSNTINFRAAALLWSKVRQKKNLFIPFVSHPFHHLRKIKGIISNCGDHYAVPRDRDVTLLSVYSSYAAFINETCQVCAWINRSPDLWATSPIRSFRLAVIKGVTPATRTGSSLHVRL